ncbi:hypothetical protein FGG08_007614, partial [Glutinoglossum americanum]
LGWNLGRRGPRRRSRYRDRHGPLPLAQRPGFAADEGDRGVEQAARVLRTAQDSAPGLSRQVEGRSQPGI